MKKYIIYILVLLLCSCNSSIEIKNSRKELLQYNQKGYLISLNDSLIKIDQLILDEEKIQNIDVDRWNKIIKIKHKEKKLNLIPISWILKSYEKNQLLIIDSLPIESKKLNSMEMEYHAFRSVSVRRNSIYLKRKYDKIIWVWTTNNDR